MIAVDTNLLIYAHRRESDWHEAAKQIIVDLAEGKSAWAIPWPCIHEFLAIVTHPKIYDPPTPTGVATDQVEAWMESPSLVLLGEGPSHWPVLRRLIEKSKVGGPRIHDARVAAICLDHGVRELLTADRDFGRFPELPARNPLAL